MFAALLTASTALAQSATKPPEPPPKWGPSLDFEGKAGTRRHLGEADLLVPLLQDDSTLLFANARFRFDDDSSKEGNIGLGVRRMVAGGWNLGAYGYFDRRRSENDHMFNQATFGAEALGADFDVRANLYLPFGERVKQVDSLNAAELSGTSVVFRGGEERAIPGFDAELGWRLPMFDADGPYELRLYGGGFRFDDPAVPAVAGPRLRAEFTAYEVPYLWEGARLTIGAEWQTDDVRGGQAFGSVRFRIPLQAFAGGRAPRPTAQERRMTAPAVRDVDVVSQSGAFGTPETVTQTAGGSTLSVLSSASTAGAALPGAVTAAGADSTVILSGTFNVTTATTLQSGQTVMGAGTLTVVSPSGRTATLTTPAATLTGALAGDSIVRMGTNGTASGLTVTNTDGGAASGGIATTAAGARILNNTITTSGTSASVVDVSSAANVTVSGNTISAGGTNLGILLNNADSATVSGNTITTTGAAGDGVRLIGGNTNVTVSGNTFGNIGGDVIQAGDGLGVETFTAASTGNRVTGAVGGARCNEPGGNATGTVTFTDGNNCNF